MLVFVYGTLTDPERADQLLDSYAYVGAAELRGLHRVDGDYPTLAPGGSVTGRLLRTDDIATLDAYEGVDHGLYARLSVPLSGASDAGADPPDTVAVYVGDPAHLSAAAEWPGDASFPACVREFIEDEPVSVNRK